MESNTSQPSKHPLGYRSVFQTDAEIRQPLDGLLGDMAPQVRGVLEALVTDIVTKGRHFEARTHVLLRQRFGSSSEAIPGLQLLLLSVSDAKAADEITPVTDETSVLSPAQLRLQTLDREKELAERRLEQARRRSLLRPVLAVEQDFAFAWDGLERRRHPATVPAPCSKCGLIHDIIDIECSYRLVYEPARFVVEEHQRNVLAPCRGEEGKPTRDPLPDKPIDKGLYDWSVVAQCLEWRYADQIPAHHISLMTERLGLKLPSSSLGDYFEAVDALVQPLVELYKEAVLTCEHLGVDDTRMLTLTPGKGGKTVKGRLWCYVGCDDLQPAFLYYTYTPDWKGERPREVLKGQTGPVQGDGYAGLDPEHHAELAFAMAGCHDHSRRKFDVALRMGELLVIPALELYQKLYGVERVARLEGLDEPGRLLLRQKFSVPYLDELSSWVKRRRGSATVGVLEGKALTYFENQEEKLRRYLGDGRVPISNIEVERRIKPIARGRRLHLFAGSADGGARMGNLYTVLQNVLLAGERPYPFLLKVLPMLKRGASREELLAVLPLHPAARRALARRQPGPNASPSLAA